MAQDEKHGNPTQETDTIKQKQNTQVFHKHLVLDCLGMLLQMPNLNRFFTCSLIYNWWIHKKLQMKSILINTGISVFSQVTDLPS